MKKLPKLVICVTFFFVEERLIYLHKISSQFANLADKLEVYIITNEKNRKMDILKYLADYNLNIKVVSPVLLGHPFLLTWCHFDIFRTILKTDPTVTHFLYLEDDIYITQENIIYWLEGRERLRHFGLIPSFLRYELDETTGNIFSTDITSIIELRKVPKIYFKEIDYLYLNSPQPYQGMYLLDRELMKEHLQSYSSNPDFGMWHIREKATQGITFLNVPQGFTSRNLIGFDMKSKKIDSRCLIHHMPNNYVTNKNVPFAKISINNLISSLPDINEYKHKLVKKENYHSSYHELALIYLEQGQYEDALEYAKMSVNLNNDNLLYYQTLGQILEKLEQIKTINFYFSPSVNLTQEKIFAFLALGDFLMRDHKYTEAIQIYKEALILKPQDAIILSKLAQASAINK